MVLAVTYPWASASSYLSSQSVADSRCNPHATPRSSYSHRSPSRRFFLCRSTLLCLVLQTTWEAPSTALGALGVRLLTAHPGPARTGTKDRGVA